MKQAKTTQLTVFGMALMLLAVASTFAQSESQSTKKPYHRNGSEGSLTGTVSLSGAAPKPRQIDMSADPVCYENNPKPLTESIVGTDGHLANVLIYVKTSAALEGLSFEVPAYVGVFSHPFFAVSDSKGAFTIEGLPPGNYTFAAWHEEFGEKSFDVTIYPNSLQNLDVNFDMADRGAQSR
ncbi:MAG TPA: carboxypeptidase-like regulatory domain-containing protein [Pyrinomonadaceae bacterium]|nr:carboxypeptidase-like regulatory domain-containing protein [Pyrinomonadaceae bacterium]